MMGGDTIKKINEKTRLLSHFNPIRNRKIGSAVSL
jgi:hypothetical protein